MKGDSRITSVCLIQFIIYIYIYNKIYIYIIKISRLYGWYLARLYRRVRLEAALRRMLTVWHQSTARTIRMHRIRLLSYRSRGIWCHTVIILRSAASSRTRLLNSKRESRGVARLFNQSESRLPVHHFALSLLFTWDWLACLRGRDFVVRACGWC